ncbi:hypothetical protein ABZ990_10970 [Streptomyces sp. NPDC046203]|uniref:hypothetical protein n=1 Tax=Streptomyces sp. NPDC046203 TaxID=3154602 RepID=UPI0033D49D69
MLRQTVLRVIIGGAAALVLGAVAVPTASAHAVSTTPAPAVTAPKGCSGNTMGCV